MFKNLAIALTVLVTMTACGKSAEEKAEDKIKGFHCLNIVNGSHLALEKWTKKQLRDPSSFEHISTRITPVKDGKHTLIMQYRAKNGFGGFNNEAVVAEIDNATCKGTVISK